MDSTYNSKSHEQAVQEFWEKNAIYSADKNPGPLYSIDTPPPTVSGSLHIGHVFSYTHADIIARYKRMSGFSVFYPIGFDDNGLATERYVEKALKISPLHMSRSSFIAACLQQTAETEKQFESLWKQLGLSFDWSATYSTINALSRKISQQSFIELLKKNYIYRKDEPAPYCATCRTSVAQAELDDKEIPSQFSEIVFKDSEGNDLLIATTRPELLSSCVAVLYHPTDTRYSHLKNTKARVPLYDFEVPILSDENVSKEKGTGLVMCCTFGDKTDIAWYKSLSLPYVPSIGKDGRMNERATLVAGKKVGEARKQILELLDTAGILRAQKSITHAVNIHERCGQEIEYLAFPQWFISILPYKKIFIELGEQIAWYPAFMKSRYTNWVENLGWDWCISRQRFYGIPFPVWYCTHCKAILLPDEKDLPLDPQETQYFTACSYCGSSDIIPDTDVMDTWNTSSLTPYICKALSKKQEFIPMSLRPQAHDIIRTWAFYTIVKTWMHDQTIPWKDIIISGHVVAKGEKISKSQGNNPLAPEKLLETYPADAIRYWTAAASLGHDVAFSENQLRVGNRLTIKLWNAFRLIHEHAPTEVHVSPESHFSLVHNWICARLHETLKEYHSHFNTYEISIALQSVEKFFWHDFCDNYLEIIKDQFFHPDAYTVEERTITQWILREVGLKILQLYAPYLPHVTETLFGLLYKNAAVHSIHQLRFNATPVLPNRQEDITKMDILLTVIREIRRLKSEHHISLKTDIASLKIYCAPSIATLLEENKNVFMPLTRSHTVEYLSYKEMNSQLEQIHDAWHAHIVLPGSL